MAVDSEKNIVTGKDIYIEDAKKDFLNNINFIGETTQKTEEPIDWKEAQGNNLYLTDISRTEIKDFNILGEITQEVIEEEEGITIEEESIYVDNVDTNKENSINIKGNTPTQEVIEAEKGTTVEGESVVVADGDTNKEVKVTVNGNSYQETTEGYNLLNPANLLLFNANKYIQTKTRIDVMPNTEYSIVSNKSFTDISVNAYSDDTNNEKLTTTSIIKGNKRYYTFTTKANTKTLFFYAGQDTEYATLEEFIETLEMMLIKGTEDKPYEPYTGGQASPSPDYKQDIEVIDGVNRLDIPDIEEKTENGITYSVKNGVLKMNGTSTTAFGITISKPFTFKKGTYTHSIFPRYKERMFASLQNTTLTMLGNDNNSSRTFTLEEDRTFTNYLIWIQKEGVSFDNEEFTFQVSEGTEVKPYLPYGHIGLKQRGKNYFNKNNSTENKFIYEENGVEASSSVSDTSDYIPVKANKKYLVTYKYDSLLNTNVRAYCYFNTNKKYLSGNNYVISEKKVLINPTQDGYIRFSYDKNCYDIQVEDGEVATEYEPYIEPIVHSIDLVGEKLAKVGEIADKLKIARNGSVKIGDKVIKEYVLTGDESFYMNITSDNYIRFSCNLPNVKYINIEGRFLDIMCNYFKPSENNNYSICFRYKNQGFFYPDETITTIEEFKAWVKEKYNSGNPLKVMYVLDTPQTINLPSIEPITLFEGTNVFELVTNLGTTMTVTYNYVTPSPSINRPSEVNIVDGNYDVVVGNKNILRIIGNGTISQSDGKTISTDDLSISYTDYMRVENKFSISSNDSTSVYRLFYYDKDKKYLSTNLKNNGSHSIDSNIKYIRMQFNNLLVSTNLQVETGTATDYIEHQEQVYPLDTTEYPLYSENDYYYKSDDKWYVHNEWSKYVFTGNESWGQDSDRIDREEIYHSYYISLNNMLKTDDYRNSIFSNIAKVIKNNYSLLNGISGYNDAKSQFPNENWLYINSKDISSIADLKNITKNNYIIYQLATPTETEITNPVLIEQLEALYNANLYETITNINSEGNTEVLPIIKLYYNFVTPAPSVNKKSEILGSKGNYNIKFENENFLDNSQVQFNITSGITTSFRDGKIHLNGTLDNIFQSAMVTSIDFKVNETGEYSFNVIGNIPTKYFTLRYADTNALIMDLISKDTINQTVLLEKNINYRIGIGVYSGFEYTIENTSFNLILVKGKNIPTTYIEHQEQVYPLSLSDIELNGKDNIRDTFIIELDNSYSFKKIKKLYLKSMFKKRDFAEEPLISTECSNAVIQGHYLTFNNIKRGTTLIYSTHQKHRKPNDYSTDTEWQKMNGNYIGQLYPTADIGLYVNIKFDTKEKFINWWNNLAPTLVYELDNPILTEIIDETLIQQIENLINNIEIYENTTYINLDGIGEIYIKYDGYDGMPSLKSPSELLSIKGEQTVTIRNANKFILLSYQNPGTIFEQNGIMFIMNNDGSINIFGYAEEDAEWYLVGGIDKEYEPIMTLNNNNILQLYDNKNTNVYIYLINNKNVIAMTNSKNSFTYNGEIDTIMIRVNKGTSIDTTIYPILTDENENTDNIKFEQQLYTIRLGNIELNGNNNVRDTFEIEFSQDDTGFKNINKLYHNKNFNKYIFTGDEDISLDSINNGIARFNIENIFINKVNNYLGIYCNYFRNENTNLENTIRSEIDNIVTTAVIFIDENIANTADSFKAYLKRLYDEGNPIETIYQLANPEKILIEDENLIQDMQNLLNATTYEGVNKIKSTATIVIEYTVKYKDNYDFYVDENNKFFYVPEYGIKFLFSPTESNIPEIAEASETSVKIAGKDGDEVLATTYEPLSFDLVCYTNENLDSKQKIAEISKVTRFLESIKYEPKNLALLDAERMIPVKYIKNLTTTRYPKSVKFSIPLKSSKSYTSILYPTKIFGNGEAYSSTIKETGCIITINGPAQIPIIYLNNYEIKYNNVILDGNKLIIDTGNSTVTHITSNGVKTNAAAYYNHEYPKIQYGMNKIEIKSGIGYDKQVITEWYDLKN